MNQTLGVPDILDMMDENIGQVSERLEAQPDDPPPYEQILSPIGEKPPLSPLNIQKESQGYFSSMLNYFIPQQPFSTVVSQVMPSFKVQWLPCLDDPIDPIEQQAQEK